MLFFGGVVNNVVLGLITEFTDEDAKKRRQLALKGLLFCSNNNVF